MMLLIMQEVLEQYLGNKSDLNRGYLHLRRYPFLFL